jgi:hypothetical protein
MAVHGPRHIVPRVMQHRDRPTTSGGVRERSRCAPQEAGRPSVGRRLCVAAGRRLTGLKGLPLWALSLITSLGGRRDSHPRAAAARPEPEVCRPEPRARPTGPPVARQFSVAGSISVNVSLQTAVKPDGDCEGTSRRQRELPSWAAPPHGSETSRRSPGFGVVDQVFDGLDERRDGAAAARGWARLRAGQD